MAALGSADRRGILTGGTWCVDRNKIIDRWPAEDAAVEILGEAMRGGGSGCNLAVDIRRLDPSMPVETIGLVGDDPDGRFLIAEAEANGIGRAGLHVTDAAPTHYTDAYASRLSGRRTHLYNPGTAALLTPDHFDFSDTRCRFLHLGLPGVHRLMDEPWGTDANGWVTVLAKARAAGLATNLELVSIAPERIAALARPCLPHLDMLVVNDVEIGALAGLDTVADGWTDWARCREAARAALALGAMAVVVVHFPAGAIGVTRDGTVVERPSVAVPREAVAGANGAGDAFAAGILYGLHEGWTLEDAVALAHATAAASLRSTTTTDAVMPWRDCMALAEAWGWRPAPAG